MPSLPISKNDIVRWLGKASKETRTSIATSPRRQHPCPAHWARKPANLSEGPNTDDWASSAEFSVQPSFDWLLEGTIKIANKQLFRSTASQLSCQFKDGWILSVEHSINYCWPLAVKASPGATDTMKRLFSSNNCNILTSCRTWHNIFCPLWLKCYITISMLLPCNPHPSETLIFAYNVHTSLM